MRLPPPSLPALALLAALPMLPPSAAAQAPSGTADLVVYDANVHTVDSLRPHAEALAARGGRLLYVGTSDSALALRGPATTVVDAHGATIIPGMTDAHGHLVELGFALAQVDLTGAHSYDEVVRRVADRARAVPPGSWVLGHGWDQNHWPGAAFPTHEALDRAVPDHPVVLSRVDGHALLANAAAMRAAGVARATADPTGGRILRAADGAPTGVFVDNAKALVERAVPAPTAEQTRAATLAAVHEANRWGLTGVHDPGEPQANIDVIEQLARDGQLTLRTYVMVAGDSADVRHYLARGPQSALYDGHVWIRAIKLYADGALGSRGAALLAPYSDDPANRGLTLTPFPYMLDVERRAMEGGFQVNVHAIGDRANRMALDLVDSARRLVPGAGDVRFRIEHAQIIAPADIPRFRQLGVIPSMQASHQTSDMGWAELRLGPERIRGAYAWRSLLNTGVIIPNGSDFPVEQVNPLLSFHAAFTRQNPANQPPGGWYPAQRMTREEALKSMTLWPAIAGFQEHDLGTLTPGKLADFVILDQDIMRVAPERVLATVVKATYVGGRRVYAAPAQASVR